jgi:hypothetical protein
LDIVFGLELRKSVKSNAEYYEIFFTDYAIYVVWVTSQGFLRKRKKAEM